MKQKRTATLLLVAIGSGLLAGYLVLDYLRDEARVRAATELPTVPVAVAAHDLAPGAVLRTQDVRVVRWPADAVPEEHAASAAEVVGRGLTLPVRASEPLLASKLAGPEAGGGLSVAIPEGMRAISVEVDEVIGVSGFVLPGTRVDVLVTLSTTTRSGGRPEAVTRVILQNVQTLAAGQTVERDPSGRPERASVVTLLVTPAQAERLALAYNEGRIHLALRNVLDLDQVSTPGVHATRLVSTPAPAEPPAPRPRPARAARPEPAAPPTHTVEMYRGAERSVATFTRRPQ